MEGAQIIVLATPVFLLLIAVEYMVGVRRGRCAISAGPSAGSRGESP